MASTTSLVTEWSLTIVLCVGEWKRISDYNSEGIKIGPSERENAHQSIRVAAASHAATTGRVSRLLPSAQRRRTQPIINLIRFRLRLRWRWWRIYTRQRSFPLSHHHRHLPHHYYRWRRSRRHTTISVDGGREHRWRWRPKVKILKISIVRSYDFVFADICMRART